MTNIYEQHKIAFARVEAFVILNNGDRVATIAFKFPADGSGRLYAYVHWIGLEMVRGYAGGGGYDKRSAACSDAARKQLAMFQAPREVHERALALQDGFEAFTRALIEDGSTNWDRCLRDAGFTVLQAV